jgi:hypothetical protein
VNTIPRENPLVLAVVIIASLPFAIGLCLIRCLNDITNNHFRRNCGI